MNAPLQQTHDADGLKADDQAMRAAIAEAGALALEQFSQGSRSWNKGDGTPVSDADLAVNQLLRERLMAHRPGYGWLSEESADDQDRLTRERVWIVDPIDGTRSFLDGTDHWCVAVAMVENGRPLIGHVLAPVKGRHYRAAVGGGAWLNNEPMYAAKRSDLARSRIIAHPGVFKPARWAKPWPDVERGMTVSLALRLCLVGSGQFDAAIALGQKCDWDLAAGDLIVREAGGRVSDLRGDLLSYNGKNTRKAAGLVAAGTNLFPRLIKQTQTFIK